MSFRLDTDVASRFRSQASLFAGDTVPDSGDSLANFEATPPGDNPINRIEAQTVDWPDRPAFARPDDPSYLTTQSGSSCNPRNAIIQVQFMDAFGPQSGSSTIIGIRPSSTEGSSQELLLATNSHVEDRIFSEAEKQGAAVWATTPAMTQGTVHDANTLFRQGDLTLMSVRVPKTLADDLCAAPLSSKELPPGEAVSLYGFGGTDTQPDEVFGAEVLFQLPENLAMTDRIPIGNTYVEGLETLGIAHEVEGGSSGGPIIDGNEVVRGLINSGVSTHNGMTLPIGHEGRHLQLPPGSYSFGMSFSNSFVEEQLADLLPQYGVQVQQHTEEKSVTGTWFDRLLPGAWLRNLFRR